MSGQAVRKQATSLYRLEAVEYTMGCWHCRASWAAGTGYGTDYSRGGPSPIWDAKHAEASQAAQDAELEKLLTDLAESELHLMCQKVLFFAVTVSFVGASMAWTACWTCPDY